MFLTTTQWSRVNWVEGEFRENRLRNLEFWGGLIEKGATLQRFTGTRESGLELIHRLMLNERKPLHIQYQIVKQHMTLLETDVGKCINEVLVVQKKKHKEELESLKKEHQEAIKVKEGEMMENFAAEKEKAHEVAVAEKKLLAELHAAEVKTREAEERERQEEAAACIKSLEEQLAAEIKKRQEGERKRQEETAAEIEKREAEEREKQEEIRRREKAAIAIAVKDLCIPHTLIEIFRDCYSTRGRWIFDINNHKEFESNTFDLEIKCQNGAYSSVWVPAKILLGLGSEEMGSTDHTLSGGTRYTLTFCSPIKRGGQDFYIFMKDKKL